MAFLQKRVLFYKVNLLSANILKGIENWKILWYSSLYRRYGSFSDNYNIFVSQGTKENTLRI